MYHRCKHTPITITFGFTMATLDIDPNYGCKLRALFLQLGRSGQWPQSISQ
jgi:hypothetical protein